MADSSVGIRVCDLCVCSAALVVGGAYLGWGLYCLGGGIYHSTSVVEILGDERTTGDGKGSNNCYREG